MLGDNVKVIVYAISKNEEKFVNRWYESMKEADEIYVLDTGSDDNTVKLPAARTWFTNNTVRSIIPAFFNSSTKSSDSSKVMPTAAKTNTNSESDLHIFACLIICDTKGI